MDDIVNRTFDSFAAELASFNENVLDDRVSDSIVKSLWKNGEFIEAVEDSEAVVGDICIMLKVDTFVDCIDNFRLSIELALDEGEFEEDQLELIADIVQEELFSGRLENYQQDVNKLVNVLKAWDPEWSDNFDEDEDTIFDMLNDAIASYGGIVTEYV